MDGYTYGLRSDGSKFSKTINQWTTVPRGDLVCTGLLNKDMPLIRYRVGDRGALRGDKEALHLRRVIYRC